MSRGKAVMVAQRAGVALVYSTTTGALERTMRVPFFRSPLGASGALVTLRLQTGTLLLRPATGASYRIELWPGDKDGTDGGVRVITLLDQGHFDAPPDVAAHVRLFVPGAKGGPVVLLPGSAQDAFRRAGPHLDDFAQP